MAIPVETFFLSAPSQGTLQARIQQMVAEGILSGRFRRGEKLPSTRGLATHLGVSRITVTLAYTELLANDYLSSRGRSGYYVSDNAPEPPRFAQPPQRKDSVDWSRAIATRFTGGATPVKPQDWARYRYPFIYGQTDPALFDHANWRLCAMQALGAKDFSALTRDYYDQDDPDLVAFIARHTLPRRGISAERALAHHAGVAEPAPPRCRRKPLLSRAARHPRPVTLPPCPNRRGSGRVAARRAAR